MIWKYNYIKYLAEISKQLNQMNFYENCIYLSGNLSEYWIGNNEIHLKRFSLQRIPNQPIKLYTKLIKFDKFRLINLGEKNKNEFHLMRAKAFEKLHRCECNKVSKTKAAYGKMELILLVFIWCLSFKVPRIGKSPAFVKQHWMQKYNVSSLLKSNWEYWFQPIITQKRVFRHFSITIIPKINKMSTALISGVESEYRWTLGWTAVHKKHAFFHWLYSILLQTLLPIFSDG